MAIPSPTSMKKARRPNQPDVFIVSGESVTLDQMAARLGISWNAVRARRRTAFTKLPLGVKLTWEHLKDPAAIKVVSDDQ